MGSNNKYGQLGHGDTDIIPYFWGLGGEGQIGQGFEIEVKLFRLLIIL